MTLFAVISFNLMGFGIACYYLQSATTVDAAYLPIRLKECFGNLVLLILPFLYRALCGQRPAWQEYLTTGFFITIISLALLRPAGFEWDHVLRMTYSGASGVYYPQGEHGRLLPVIRIGQLLFALHCMAIAWRGWRARHNGLWNVLALPVSYISALLYTIGGILHFWQVTFESGEWVSITLYLCLGASVFQTERAVLTERDTLFHSLADREGKLLALTSAGLGFACLLDLEGRIVFANRAALQLMGVSAQQVLGMLFVESPWWQHSSELRERVRNAIAATSAGATVRFETSQLNVDGKDISVDFSLSPYFDAQNRVRYLIAEGRDISDRVRAERTIQQKQRQIQDIAENMPGVIYQFFARFDGVVGLSYVSQYSLEMLGLDNNLEGYFERTLACIVEEDRKRFVDSIQYSIQNAAAWEFEGRFKKPSGEIIFIRGQSTPQKQEDRLLFNGVITDITARKLFEKRLKASFQSLRALTSHLHAVREEERVHLAREVHDELGQAFTGLKLQLSWLRYQVPGLRRTVSLRTLMDKMDSMNDLIETSITTVRRIATELRPAILDTFGLVPALEWMTQDFQNRSGLDCTFFASMENVSLDPERASAVFRIAQESLTNVIRHAQATRVNVRFESASEEHLALTIADNGIGIAPIEARSDRTYGLLGMQERALLLGGSIIFEGSPQGGTTVLLTLPMQSPLEESTVLLEPAREIWDEIE